MVEASYKQLQDIISKMDKIFNKCKLVLVKVNNYDYVVSGYKVTRDYILLYFGKDFLGAYRYSDIKEIKELM